jgi:UDP-N-acetylglucosamine 4-epimerase
MTPYDETRRRLQEQPLLWLVTGVAGFIGSNLLQALLELDQKVVGLDNFVTGRRANLEEVRASVSAERWVRFRLLEGDVASPEVCARAVQGVDRILHQAALGSVPRSIERPLETNAANVTGQLALLEAARRAGVRRFVFASSSSVYGDDPGLPKVEDRLGRALSPYAVSKRADELYAWVYARLHGLEPVGLRYFNVFGPRQDPDGPYAAVIPRWLAALVGGQEVRINGTGETSRDFCYVANVVQANLLAACGTRTTLLELFEALRRRVVALRPALAEARPVHGPFRPGDVMHSLADIDKARRLLGYRPSHLLDQGLDEAIDWYLRSL